MKPWQIVLVFIVFSYPVLADGPADNLPKKVRQIPPPGIQVPEQDQKTLQAGVESLGKSIEILRRELKGKPALLALLPDVQIYHNAVRYALTYNEFFHPRELKHARKLLEDGQRRAEQLRQGKSPWTTATGLVVRGYRSKIDGSIQPFGLVIPQTYRPGTATKHRLDLWYHGRGEKLSEVNFIHQRQTNPGRFTPADTIVLHPYGRYSNANHFAGEIDTFECLDAVKSSYSIDENRIVVRGFSMGGAACWHFAVHHAGNWVAAAPGAGFSETPKFLRTFQKETLNPTWYERKLWHLYDCTDYAINLYHCPTVAYSGEIDRQKQAADIMAKAMAKAGLTLTHIIGPKTGHGYHPLAKKKIDQRIDSIAAKGRNPVPKRIRFTTWTLRYHKMLWVEIDGMEQHWERARVNADILNDHTIKIETKNVNALTLRMPAGHCPLDPLVLPTVILDGTKIHTTPVQSDRSWLAQFHKTNSGWVTGALSTEGKLHKQHGLQGPIDDAFMDSFVMVRPTGKSDSSKVEKWVQAELAHAMTHWRKQFRGEAQIKDDVKITNEDIQTKNLILWGDPKSNSLLAKIHDKLPIRHEKGAWHLLGKSWSSEHHVPVMIYPNPLNPKRYVVLNSGFTYREYDYLNNARQVPKLPDFAIVNVNVPVTSRKPGGIVEAGFFDEWWQLSNQ